MSIKRRIWALPVISAIIFGLGAGASAMIATGALDSITTTESVDYPVLDASKALSLDVAAVTFAPRAAAGSEAFPVPAATSSTRIPASTPHASTSCGPSGSRNVSTIDG